MARLVLLNGPPASGKSTLARRYVEDHPLALALDIDVVRSMLGGRLEQPVPAGLAARALALAMARVHLTAGHDVVVPQLLGRLEFVLELERLAGQVGVPFFEVMLQATPEQAAGRFARRSADGSRVEHRDATVLLAGEGGPDALATVAAQVRDVVRSRPATRTVVTADGRVEQAYLDLRAVLDGPPERTSG